MNPISILGGSGSGFTGGSAESGSGSAGGTSGTGHKNISFGGGNPNTVGGVLSNPVVLIAIVGALYLILKK